MHKTFLAVAAMSISALAATPPPAIELEPRWNATQKALPVLGLVMGSLRITFEETTLDQVRNAAGAGAIAHQGDAGESIYWLCFTNESRGERIWIVAHGEMGGPEHAIGQVSAEPSVGAQATKECPALPKGMQPFALDNGLWLGAPESKVAELGVPSNSAGAWRSFEYQGKVPGDCEGGFDLMNWLRIKTDKGRIISLHAGQVTSC